MKVFLAAPILLVWPVRALLRQLKWRRYVRQTHRRGEPTYTEWLAQITQEQPPQH